MDIGKRKDDYEFYEGYEGEKDVAISLPDITYHIWEGYFEDIFGNPQSTDKGWAGFTRDYNEFINTFDDNYIECAIEPEEYLKDVLLYKDKGQLFDYGESEMVLNLLIAIMKEAEEKKLYVFVKVN